MITTTHCVICNGEAIIFGGHVHKDDETVIAGRCEKHRKDDGNGMDGCKGCYGQWKQEMGYKDPDAGYVSTYGTDKSDFLKFLIDGGHKPLGITVMACEETLIFQTKEEVLKAMDFVNAPGSGWGNEGWFYAIEDDGEWPWEKGRKDYVDSCYDGKEEKAPEVYWLNK